MLDGQHYRVEGEPKTQYETKQNTVFSSKCAQRFSEEERETHGPEANHWTIHHF